MKRLEANLQILAKITRYVTMNPDMRFGQALRNLGVIIDFKDVNDLSPQWMNHFSEEPVNMLKRMEQEEKKEGMT